MSGPISSLTISGTVESGFTDSLDSNSVVDSGDSLVQSQDDTLSDILLANHIDLKVATGHLSPYPTDREGTEVITPEKLSSQSSYVSCNDGVTQEPDRLLPFPTCNTAMTRPADQLLTRPLCSVELEKSCATYASIYRAVKSVGLPNYRGARIPVPSNIRADVWRQHIHKCSDAQLPDMLQYGFPAGYQWTDPFGQSQFGVGEPQSRPALSAY